MDIGKENKTSIPKGDKRDKGTHRNKLEGIVSES